MRIISGFFKGKRILEPKDNKTRPLKDLTKESIFNIILHSKKLKIDLYNSYVLDLFSGVGSFGIECLSRGVKKVVFVENYLGVLPVLKENLESLKTVKNYEIIEKNIYDKNTFFEFEEKFNLIFLDPPYKDKNLDKLFSKIELSKIISNDGIVILHRNKDDKEFIPSNYKIVEEKKYGISKILFISLLN